MLPQTLPSTQPLFETPPHGGDPPTSDSSLLRAPRLREGISETRLASFQDFLVQDRQQAVREIHQSTVALQQILLDQSLLVRDQGEQVDNIELAVARACVDTRRGVDTLRRVEVRKNWFDGITATLAAVGSAAAVIALVVLL